MAKYLTKQRKLLLDYLSAHTDETLSAHKVAEDLSDKGISTSAVYRNLSLMEQDGQVRKVGMSDTKEAYYQYIDAKRCRECLHLSCIKCGRTFHLEDDITAQLLKMVARDEQFQISKTHTILYGICKSCCV